MAYVDVLAQEQRRRALERPDPFSEGIDAGLAYGMKAFEQDRLLGLEREKLAAQRQAEEEAELRKLAITGVEKGFFDLEGPPPAATSFGGFNFKPVSPEERAKRKAEEKANAFNAMTPFIVDRAGKVAEVQAPQRLDKDVDALRKEVSGLAQTKELDNVLVGVDKVKTAGSQPSAAGDLALLYGFNKILDPNSTIRESEFANAAAAGSVDQRILGAWQKVVSGQRLSPEQRKDFIDQANKLAKSQMDSYKRVLTPFEARAKAKGLPMDQIFRPLPTFDDAPKKQVIQNGYIFDIQPDGTAVPVGPVKK